MNITSFDVTRARKDTEGCERVLHFNNAGAALMPRQVVETVVNHLKLEAATGGYEAAEVSDEKIQGVYESLGRLMDCGVDEIAVVENATRAWDMAFYGIPFRSGDRILTSEAEYASNYIAFLQVSRRTGAVIEVIPNDSYGQVSVDALRDMLDEHVKLIAVNHVPTNGGLVNPAADIGKAAREAGVLYLLDACQSVGQIPINVKKIVCDMLSGTGRKFLRGPRGTGFLYVRREVLNRLEPPFLDLHAACWTASEQYEIRSDARRFENWETNVAGKLGLGAAVDYALSWGIENIWNRVSALAQFFRDSLAGIPGTVIHDLGRTKCGIVSFTIKGKSSREIKSLLSKKKINVSVSPIEYTRLDMEKRRIESMVRASVHYYNTEEEVLRFTEEIKRLSTA
ncbi:MAG: aminotransferase class V-fold PLP-dependent enzyme [Candidatus Aminicenantes bacterium]|nr:aminotransferase class V-fold PLP-dependent enzyme [Candidatus Aminicenantes bacterium]